MEINDLMHNLMNKRIFLFVVLLLTGIFCSCDKIEKKRPSKSIVVERESCFDDGIAYDGYIAILGGNNEDVIEAATLRFLKGITTEVTRNTRAVIVLGNPSDFFYDINEVLANDGVVFIYEPKVAEIKKWVGNEDSLLLLSEDSIDDYNLEDIALLGVTMDGSVYTYEKSHVEALEAELVPEEPVDGPNYDGGFTRIEDIGHDSIYDSSEYQMFAGIVEFLSELDDQYKNNLTKADGKEDKFKHGSLYQKDIEVPMRHSFDKHQTWDSDQVGYYSELGRFSVKFDITHAFDFEENGDYYFVKAHYQAHCNTFCKSPWQSYSKWRAHTVQGDVLKSVTFDAVPIVGKGKGYNLTMARSATPQNVPEKRDVRESKEFEIGGELNLGKTGESNKGGEEGDSSKKGYNGSASAKAGYKWGREVTFTTYEWYVTNTSTSSNSVGYSIFTSEDLESVFKTTDQITVKHNAYGTIDVMAAWVWNIKETKKDTYDKGIEKIRVNLRDFTTQWVCQVELLPTSKTRKTQHYSSASVDIALGLTNRTEYGALAIKNDLSDYIRRIKVYNANNQLVYDSKAMALAPGQTYDMCLPTQYKYNVILQTNKGVIYEYIKDGGELLGVERIKATELASKINFSEIHTKAIIRLRNNFAETIKYIKLVEVGGDGNKIDENSFDNGLEAGASIDLPVEPGKKYIVKFSAKQGKWKSYEFSAPPGEPQHISLEKAGDVREINAKEDFDQI